MKEQQFHNSHAWMGDQLQEAFEILREVRENIEGENGEPVTGYKRIWRKLDNALESVQGAMDAILGKGYPEDETEEQEEMTWT